MPDTTTTNLGLTKVEIGASEGTWGTKLNTNFDLLDNAILGLGTLLTSADTLAAALPPQRQAGRYHWTSANIPSGSLPPGSYTNVVLDVQRVAPDAWHETANCYISGNTNAVIYRRMRQGFSTTQWKLDTQSERGTNANGEYVRFTDGTQICTFAHAAASEAISTAFMGGFRSALQSWSFPIGFIAPPVVTVVPTASTAFGAITTAISGTGYNFAYTAVTSQVAAARSASIIAVGRWF